MVIYVVVCVGTMYWENHLLLNVVFVKEACYHRTCYIHWRSYCSAKAIWPWHLYWTALCQMCMLCWWYCLAVCFLLWVTKASWYMQFIWYIMGY